MRPIYSIRTAMGSELYWTTSRNRAIELAEQLTEVGDYVHSAGCVGHEGEKGLRPWDLPVAVHKCSAITPRIPTYPVTRADGRTVNVTVPND